MDGSSRRVAAALVAVAVALPVVLSGTLGAAATTSTPQQALGAPSVDPDQVLLTVDVQPDGNATWHIEYLVRLETDNETAAFEALQQDIANNESAFISDFKAPIQNTVAVAENSTGRSMSATDFDVSTRITQIPQRYGILTYTFTWTNFAAVEDGRLLVGDALAGFFLDSETTLTISWPADYRIVSVSPQPSETRENAVVWRGPLDFGSAGPRVILAPEAAATPTTTVGGPTVTDEGPGPTPHPDPGFDAGFLALVVGTVLAVLLLVAVAAFLYVRRYGLPGRGAGPGPSPGPGPGPGTGGGAAGEPPGGETAGGAPGGGPAPGATAAADDEAAGEAPPDELLSNEERVIRFLDAEGGRVKQQEIVDGLGWTDAKTSQVLSGMAADDQIEKFRIGRENVVKLPDDESTSDE